MSFEARGAAAPDQSVVGYPGSSLRFRGPGGDLAQAHVLCLGGTETFGRFVDAPYPNLLADKLGTDVINMGVAGGGLDVVLNDAAIADAMGTATEIVLQVQGAQNISNRLYTVHPRRNDRFVRASDILRTIYRDVDFTEFHFTRHMLEHLRGLSLDRFDIVRNELRVAWMARMKRFLCDAKVPVHLLWLACRPPSDDEPEDTLSDEPMFVTSAMLEAAAKQAASLTVVSVPSSTDDRPEADQKMMKPEALAARLLPGAEAHKEAADLLSQLLTPE